MCIRDRSYIASAKKTNQEIIENAGTQINAKTSEYLSLIHISKQQLLKTDKEASAAREKAYQDWLIVSRNSILP